MDYLIVLSQSIDAPEDALSIYATRIFHNIVIERQNLTEQVVNSVLKDKVGLATSAPKKTVEFGDETELPKESRSGDKRARPLSTVRLYLTVCGAHASAKVVFSLSAASQNQDVSRAQHTVQEVNGDNNKELCPHLLTRKRKDNTGDPTQTCNDDYIPPTYLELYKRIHQSKDMTYKVEGSFYNALFVLVKQG